MNGYHGISIAGSSGRGNYPGVVAEYVLIEYLIGPEESIIMINIAHVRRYIGQHLKGKI